VGGPDIRKFVNDLVTSGGIVPRHEQVGEHESKNANRVIVLRPAFPWLGTATQQLPDTVIAPTRRPQRACANDFIHETPPCLNRLLAIDSRRAATAKPLFGRVPLQVGAIRWRCRRSPQKK
jgi:hypothetical protein